MLEFKDEMLIPQINGQVYYAIYELENWVRRICLTVYMQAFGHEWINEVPPQVLNGVKNMINNNSKLSYIGADNDENIIWMATQGQLTTLLKNDDIKDNLENIIGFDRDLFLQKINELRQIRNFLAHNRALSKSTEIIVNGIIEALRLTVKNFKKSIIYSKEMNIIGGDTTDKVGIFFDSKMENNDWKKFQAFIEKGDYFYSLVCLPVEPFDRFPSAYKLLEAYRPLLGSILAFLINKACDEYSILFPKNTNEDKIFDIIERFVLERDVWTTKGFEEQNPMYICNPKIWFYENREPIEE